MSWTDDRVERLSSLWLEGRSASQIAAELGEGVSRNAVIGKVHRLGLSGRAVPSAADPAPPLVVDIAPPETPVAVAAQPEPEPVAVVAVVAAEAPTLAAHTVDDVAAVIGVAPGQITFERPMMRAAKDVVIPISGRVTILELSGSMCRWPIGDPTKAEFRFCGCHAVGTLPYCQDHARVAFQPVVDRRRTDRMIRIA